MQASKHITKDFIYNDLEKNKLDKKTINRFLSYIEIFDLNKSFYEKIKYELIQYQKLKNKITFKPLTLDHIKHNLNKNISFYMANGENPNEILGPELVDVKDRNNHKKVFSEAFKPNGDIMILDRRKNIQTIYKNWFKNKQVELKKGQYVFILDDLFQTMQVCDPNEKGERQLAYNCMNTAAWIPSKK